MDHILIYINIIIFSITFGALSHILRIPRYMRPQFFTEGRSDLINIFYILYTLIISFYFGYSFGSYSSGILLFLSVLFGLFYYILFSRHYRQYYPGIIYQLTLPIGLLLSVYNLIKIIN